MSPAVTKAADEFRTEVTNSYEMDSDFIDAVVAMFVKHASTLYSAPAEAPAPAKAPRKTAAKAATAPGEPKPTRKKSAYNVFVRQQMATEAIKLVPHKEKMGQIAACWGALTPEEKAEFTELARQENESQAQAETA